MNNININPYASIRKAPYKIVFSTHSSSTSFRNIHFEEHRKNIVERLSSKYELEVYSLIMSALTLEEQIQVASTASIYITMCGGGAVTSMFLPKGASLIAFFNEEERGGDNETPPRLDWDLLNNLSYLRVHWLPRPQKFQFKPGPSKADIDAFVRLVDHELDIISHHREGH